ncbi:MAG: hypothetical protein COT92_01100 [Candidatus Doudnabacteria bacterium CG10_big_fil_rev_8_21_14_0_10_42_18]|uniref:SpoVT-AbrB domain-containing protein n=1 Tax=Candidatus Doudnabacteria bacterium CG10_big_fil_rev_8_21_14_0_10_42_18 TaxID=1974552 RepID=A0A2H0VDJ5_9BACT|nr:MAG: hypothetical protein COT92_01100 [Candidatus Doudnabacteria bacterium CG10_big_fil_rev_8_21_14_0_10_42_18]
MTITVKNKSQLTVPKSISRKAGIRAGDKLEFKVIGRVISIVPHIKAADDEYTSAQRRIIDARLAKAKKGPYYGPFDTAAGAIKFLRKQVKQRETKK